MVFNACWTKYSAIGGAIRFLMDGFMVLKGLRFSHWYNTLTPFHYSFILSRLSLKTHQLLLQISTCYANLH